MSAKIITIELLLNEYCIDIKKNKKAVSLLKIDTDSGICARCTLPFNTTDRRPSKIAAIDEDNEIYLIFCDHCDKYIRNDDGFSDNYIYI